MTAERGERGPKGDHGQDGATGERGRTGATGEAGPYMERRQIVSLFAFIVLAFVLLAYRTEVNDRRQTEYQFHRCLATASLFEQFNAQQKAFIAIETTNRFVDQSIRDARVKAYTDALLPIPECGKP